MAAVYAPPVLRRLQGARARAESLTPSEQRRLGWLLLGLGSLLAVGLTLYFSRGRTFALDEWKYLVERRVWSWDSLMVPDNGHLMAIPMAVYKLLADVFGATSHLPFSLVTALVAQVVIPVLLYLFARPSLGPLGALIPAILIAFLGSGWEVMMSPAGFNNQFGLAFGLGAMLSLRRGDRAGDLGAAALLAASLFSYSIGIAFAAGVLVETALGRNARRRVWIALVPAALYGVWWVWARKYGGTDVTGYAVGSIFNGVFDEIAAGLAAITGLFRQSGSPDVATAIVEVRTDRAAPLVFLLVAAIVLRLMRGPRPSPRVWGVLVIFSVYLLLVGSVLAAGRPPDASRYAYMAAVLILLVLVALSEGIRLPSWWGWAAAAVLAISLVANIAGMRTAGTFFRAESDYNRAELAALEAARGTVSPDFVPETGFATLLPHEDLHFTAAEYFAAIDQFGSPALPQDQLPAAGEAARELADQVSARAVDIRLHPTSSVPPPGAPPPQVAQATGGVVHGGGGCVFFRTRPAAVSELELRVPRGHDLAIRNLPGEGLKLSLARFADAPSVVLRPVHGNAMLELPMDRAAVPWRVFIQTSLSIAACSA
jgi:hypothetical protein